MIDLRHGDMRDVLPTIEAESVHSVVTDPPYELAFMGRHWDQTGVAFQPDTWRAVHRALKPGGYLLSFGGTRTQHRMICAIEDAGFEIRDVIAWVYGSGFPKSLDIGKAIDRAAGAEREVVGIKPGHEGFANRGNMSSVQSFKGTMGGDGGFARPWMDDPKKVEAYHQQTTPATAAARQWNGWGTALKPAMELVCVARKPLSERTVAGNVLKHGTGGINVDACRVAGSFQSGWSISGSKASDNLAMSGANYARDPKPDSPLGRWPANVVHDGSPEVEAAFAAFGERTSGTATLGPTGGDDNERFWTGKKTTITSCFADSGSASRFFYSAKATASDRADSRHPTVKPIDLIRWLVRMVTPPNGTVLDPFAGSGTTGEAAMLEGFNAILIEREAEHAADIQHRQRRWHGGDLPLFEETLP